MTSLDSEIVPATSAVAVDLPLRVAAATIQGPTRTWPWSSLFFFRGSSWTASLVISNLMGKIQSGIFDLNPTMHLSKCLTSSAHRLLTRASLVLRPLSKPEHQW